MKSGILATTTLLVILGTVEQVQAQTETDREHEYDFTGFSYGSDPTPATNLAAEENDRDDEYVSLAWQTDFATESSAIADREQLASLSPLPEVQTPLLADFRTEATNRGTHWSDQFRPHVPSRTAIPAPKPESFREPTNRDRGSYDRDRNFPGSMKYRQTDSGSRDRSSTWQQAWQQVGSLSSHPVRQPEIPPLAAATNYLPEVQEQVPVFNGYNWPAQGTISSHYGWRWGRMHSGIDIAAPIGTPILAAADGVVITSEWNSGGYGNLVEIEHPNGSITLYAHNSENRVRVGDVVKKGQLIALMGSTGYSTGPHLHFELRIPGQGAVNPSAYLPSGDSVAHQHW